MNREFVSVVMAVMLGIAAGCFFGVATYVWLMSGRP